MAQTKRKPAAEKLAAQNIAPEAGGAAVQPDANPKPGEAATPPQAASGDAPPQEPPSPQEGPGDLVRVRTLGKTPRRRAGRAFGPEPVDIVLGELGEGELDALLGDPRLAVELIDA